MPDQSSVAIFPLCLGVTRGQGIINVTSDKGNSLPTRIGMSKSKNRSKVSKTKSIIYKCGQYAVTNSKLY